MTSDLYFWYRRCAYRFTTRLSIGRRRAAFATLFSPDLLLPIAAIKLRRDGAFFIDFSLSSWNTHAMRWAISRNFWCPLQKALLYSSICRHRRLLQSGDGRKPPLIVPPVFAQHSRMMAAQQSRCVAVYARNRSRQVVLPKTLMVIAILLFTYTPWFFPREMLFTYSDVCCCSLQQIPLQIF